MNAKNYLHIAFATAWGLAATACSDDLSLEDAALAGSETSGAGMVVTGDEQFCLLPDHDAHGQVAEVRVTEGDFVMATRDNRLYLEQNDDHGERTATLSIVYADGYACQTRLLQTTAHAASAHTRFLHNYGVGYSYDAIYGRACNLDDVRCQILNRAVVDECMEESGEDLLLVDYLHRDQGKESVYYTKAEYVHDCYLTVDADAACTLLFSASIQADMGIAEDGKAETYTLRNSTIAQRGVMELDHKSLYDYIDDYPNMLTSSFRHSIDHLKSFVKDRGLAPNWEVAVDSFLTIYGTHVVTEATFGGEISIDLELAEKDYWTLERNGVVAQGELLKGLAKAEYSTEAEKLTHTVLNDSKCHIKVVGGDASTVDRLTSMSIYKTGSITATAIADWQTSVKFSDVNEEDNNSELIDMSVAPIWEFIPDEAVARMVENRVNGNVDNLIKLLGNRNFINTSFPMPKGDNVVVPFADGAGTLHQVDADIVDVIYAGRHVAAICKETIPEISSDDLWVVYPIYEGKLLMENGLTALPDGSCYNVCWNGLRFSVLKYDSLMTRTDTVYITAGVPSFTGYSNIPYEAGRWLPDIEMQNPINIDGTFNAGCKCYGVKKYFGHFYLNAPDSELHSALTGIPNWSYCEELPQEYLNYLQYFDATRYTRRMVRNDYYRYIYNPFEAQVAEGTHP